MPWKYSSVQFSSVQFSCSVMSNSLQPRGLQHARLPCLLPTPRAYSYSCSLSQWYHSTISSCVIPFCSCLPSFSPFLIQKPGRVRQIQPPLISHYWHIHNTSGISGHPMCRGFPTPSNSLWCQLGVPQFNSMKPGDRVRSHGRRPQSHETPLQLQMPISNGRLPGYLQLPFNLATKQRFPWPLPSWICLLEQLTELREILIFTSVLKCILKLCPGGKGGLACCSPWVSKELDMT